MNPYRLSKPDEINSQYPLKPDLRKRAAMPLVDSLPEPGSNSEIWQSAVTSDVFSHAFENLRIVAPSLGLDSDTLAENQYRAELADKVTVSALAYEYSTRMYIMLLRFKCIEDVNYIKKLQKEDSGSIDNIDYVSAIINIDRSHNKACEIGINCRGEIFRRIYKQFTGLHGEESRLQAEKVIILSSADNDEEKEAVWEEKVKSPAMIKEVKGKIWLEENCWYADLQIPMHFFDEYPAPYLAYPANFVRFKTAPLPGMPEGINWKAAKQIQTWSAVRFHEDEFQNAGFISLGNISAEEMQRQITAIDDITGRARINKRIEITARRKDAAEGWRQQTDFAKYETQWLPKAVPGFEVLDRGFVLNNSRQLVTLADGRTLVLAEDSNKLSLALSESDVDPVSNTWPEGSIELCGEDGIFQSEIDQKGVISHASMLVDNNNKLHLIFSAGNTVIYASSEKADNFSSLKNKDNWKITEIEINTTFKPYDIEKDGDNIYAVMADEKQNLKIIQLGAKLNETLLDVKGRCPVLAESISGGLHLAYERNAAIFYLRLESNLKAEKEERAAYAINFFPAIVEYEGSPLIVFQQLGMQKASPTREMYIAERERTGAGIGYAYKKTTGWHRGKVIGIEEVAVRRMNTRMYMLDMVREPHNGDAYLLPDENWRPAVSVDSNGVVRTAWQNTTREHAFWAQWTGEKFTMPREFIGPLAQPTSHLTLEKKVAKDNDLRALLAAENRIIFISRTLKSINLERSGQVTFLDEMAVRKQSGLRWQLNPMQRIQHDPVFEDEAAGQGAGRDGTQWAFVMKGKDNKWLLLAHRFTDLPLFGESDDGIEFNKINEKAFLEMLTAEQHELLSELLE
ncbi:MAG: hypothetical protein ACYTFY_21640, partial [Planctomycetota bacterium]